MEYLQQFAWLTTSAKNSEKTRGEGIEDPLLPGLGAWHYYIDLLFDAGVNDMSWESLLAWRELMQLDLKMWEMRLLKTMAATYKQWAREYNGKNIAAPFSEKDYLDNNIKSILRRPIDGN